MPKLQSVGAFTIIRHQGWGILGRRCYLSLYTVKNAQVVRVPCQADSGFKLVKPLAQALMLLQRLDLAALRIPELFLKLFGERAQSITLHFEIFQMLALLLS